MDNLTTTLISSLMGAGVAAISLLISNALNFRVRIDENLREKRLAVYKTLWEKTKILPKWPKNPDVTYENLHKFSGELRDWYFDEGGIYLTAESRKAYEVVQDKLSEVVGDHQDITIISEGDYESIRVSCSSLRTELTRDLQSRKRTFMIGS